MASSNARQTTKTFTVEIIDSIPPFIQLVGDKFVSINKGGEFQETGYFASSHQGADLTGRVSVSPQIDYNKTGAFKLTYQVTDDQGNTAEDFRIVQIYDKSPPQFFSRNLPAFHKLSSCSYI